MVIPESDPTGSITIDGLSAAVLSNRDSTGHGWIVGYSEPDDPNSQGSRNKIHLLEPIVPSMGPGIVVSQTAGLSTSESGGQDSFTLVLNTQPSANVTIGISSSDTSEGTVVVSTVTFTSSNWDTPQTVTVSGEDDSDLDGDVAYTIITFAATSLDADYSGLDADNVSVTNLDNESPPSATYQSSTRRQ